MRVQEKTRSYPSRWFTLAASLQLLVLAGVGYGFALIAQTLKDRLHMTQTEVDTVATVGSFGANTIGIAAGLCCNRYGPQLSIWIGVAITTIGYSLLTGITTQFLAVQSFECVCFVYFLVQLGTAWYSNIAIPLLAQNFPAKDRGKIIGLGKGYLGIGTAFIASFKSDLADEDVDMFMISTMIFIPVASCFAAWFIVLLPPELANKYQPNEIKFGKDKRCGLSITLWYIVAFVFAIYLVALSMVQSVYPFGVYIRYGLFGIALVIWLLPWMLALFLHGDRTLNTVRTESFYVDEYVSSSSDDEQPVVNTDEVGMPAIFRYWQLYSFFGITGIVTGTACCFMNNTPQIIESASSDAFHDNENSNISTSLVAIISFGNFFGRICGGFAVDYFPTLHYSFWMIVPSVIATVTYSAMFLSGSHLWILQIGAVFVGISIGWVFSAIVVCVSDLWGTRYLSGNFSVFNAATTMANLLFSTVIFASIYDHFAEEEVDQIQYFRGTKCYGSDCYKWTFLICACSSVVALVLSILHWRLTPKKRAQMDMLLSHLSEKR